MKTTRQFENEEMERIVLDDTLLPRLDIALALGTSFPPGETRECLIRDLSEFAERYGMASVLDLLDDAEAEVRAMTGSTSPESEQ